MKAPSLIASALERVGDRRAQLVALVTIVLTLSVFGPYIVGGIRTDQLATYVCLVILVPLNFRRLQLAGTKALLFTWSAFVLVALLAALPPTSPDDEWDRGSLLAGIDNLALPLAVMLIVWTVIPRANAYSALKTVGRILTVLVAVNALIAIVSTRVAMAPILRIFWSSADMEVTTAENSAGNGRFSGIFNHPAEAGVVYGVAGLLAVVVWQNRKVLMAALLALIVVGGVLTVSKVFLFGGLPLILIYWFVSLPSGRGPRLKALAALTALAGAAYFVAKDWSGFAYLSRLFVPAESDGKAGSSSPLEAIVDLYSAGRFTEGSDLLKVVDRVFSDHALWGVGAAGWQVPYDNGWIEALVVAGLLGAVAYTVTLVLFLVIALRQPDRHLKLFGIFLTIFLIGASLGIPALTVNRTALAVWLVVALLALLARPALSRADRKARAAKTRNADAPADTHRDPVEGVPS